MFCSISSLGCLRWDGAVKLAYTSYEGTNSGNISTNSTPIIIQHGLLGSRKNWASLSKAIHSKTGRKVNFTSLLYILIFIKRHYLQVVVPDARNHGDSPHCNKLDYEVLSQDIIQLMEDLNIPKATMVGHSMGGRAMMSVALTKVHKKMCASAFYLAVAHSHIAFSC